MPGDYLASLVAVGVHIPSALAPIAFVLAQYPDEHCPESPVLLAVGGELLIDLENDRMSRAVVMGMLPERYR